MRFGGVFTSHKTSHCAVYTDIRDITILYYYYCLIGRNSVTICRRAEEDTRHRDESLSPNNCRVCPTNVTRADLHASALRGSAAGHRLTFVRRARNKWINDDGACVQRSRECRVTDSVLSIFFIKIIIIIIVTIMIARARATNTLSIVLYGRRVGFFHAF